MSTAGSPSQQVTRRILETFRVLTEVMGYLHSETRVILKVTEVID